MTGSARRSARVIAEQLGGHRGDLRRSSTRAWWIASGR